MKVHAWLGIASVLALAVGVSAQTKPAPAAGAKPEHEHQDHQPDASGAKGANQIAPAVDVERILLGAPVNLRAATGVIRWKPDFTYETVKAGTNRLVCFDRSDEKRRTGYAVQCTSMGSLDRVAQNRRFRAESTSDADEQAKVAAAEKNGTRVKPEYGSPWMNTNGPDPQHLRTHTTIAMPGATPASLGLPDNAKQNGAWVMDGGTSSSHIMLPGQ